MTCYTRLGNIPTLCVEYTENALDLVIENFALSGGLFPNLVTVEAHNFMRFSPYNDIQEESPREFMLTFRQIQADMRDVSFYFRNKSGLPKLSDSGIADVILGGHALTVTARVASSSKDRSSALYVRRTISRRHTQIFNIEDSKHDLLQVQNTITITVRTSLEYVDGQLVTVRDCMDAAKVDGNGTQALQDAQGLTCLHSYCSIRTRVDAKTGTFKVLLKCDSAILQDVGRHESMANRAQSRSDKATKGETWHSAAFTIV
ncbi:uncharacterized protein B0H18DRAFT_888916 [Fomitopsis serialis]|uniref:uncharacterized protein n=1 Tax=Fomitopsis serialis TaxID=139415 RepID=UPI0020083AB1|nr:uncharacterized protein B0H18DRAFT_888916 [Neoantrodia serialis]KAH9913043.1 hypothetical protein B0H18DRAFT_888916 [Neoantrodia serialis]